ncbi:MAG: lipoyl(octanoyl) transferase LipB [Crocinitomicaceae bacterium]|nr:lipoyl(octanoyl) transferase LipB [Crocinitomicaceae bacterium]
MNSLPEVTIINLGLVDYKEAWDIQENYFRQAIDRKIAIRNGENLAPPSNYLILCEHPHVYTIGKSGNKENLLLSEKEVTSKEASFYKINRGGDITYHGPGQLVVYPILDLEQFFTDIHKYMRFLEEAVINTLMKFNIQSSRIDGMTGVWLDSDLPSARKICAMGVKSSRWVTMHGIGFNINTNLDFFSHIVPCGIDDKAVTSMQKELGRKIDIKEVEAIILEEFKSLFGFIVKEN